MGELAQVVPTLILAQSDVRNAFVVPYTPDGKQAAFAVVVHTGLAAAAPEDLMAILAHEFTHLARLHLIEGVSDRLSKYYAVANAEPLGYQQANNAELASVVTDWYSMARDVQTSNIHLVGFPLGGVTQLLPTLFAHKANTQECALALEDFATIGQHIVDSISYFSEDIDTTLLSAVELGALETAVTDTPKAVGAACFANASFDLIDLIAEYSNRTREQVQSSLSDEDRAAIAGKNVMDQFTTEVALERKQMRDLEASVQSKNTSWPQLRWYSAEEQADDGSLAVSETLKLPERAYPLALGTLVPQEANRQCNQLLSAGLPPPYGSLADSHHSTCFRIYHLDQLAHSGEPLAQVIFAAATTSSAARTLTARELKSQVPALGRTPRPVGWPDVVLH